jgi:NAD(P)-dependent dehydrogenase (short-subunit alcohol dehydrogenase family)
VAIVTGGDTGIGKAISVCMAREGAKVVIDYHGDAKQAEDLAASIEGFGGSACAIGADVTKPDEIDALIRGACDRYGKLDIMVNNTGTEERHRFVEMPLEVYEKTIAVDLTGVWLGMVRRSWRSPACRRMETFARRLTARSRHCAISAHRIRTPQSGQHLQGHCSVGTGSWARTGRARESFRGRYLHRHLEHL